MIREEWTAGEEAWFEYHCLESPTSSDAALWYRSHQRVTVLGVEDVGEERMPTRAERYEACMPMTYRVVFADGHCGSVFEDELTETREEWYRPDPPMIDSERTVSVSDGDERN